MPTLRFGNGAGPPSMVIRRQPHVALSRACVGKAAAPPHGWIQLCTDSLIRRDVAAPTRRAQPLVLEDRGQRLAASVIDQGIPAGGVVIADRFGGQHVLARLDEESVGLASACGNLLQLALGGC